MATKRVPVPVKRDRRFPSSASLEAMMRKGSDLVPPSVYPGAPPTETQARRNLKLKQQKEKASANKLRNLLGLIEIPDEVLEKSFLAVDKDYPRMDHREKGKQAMIEATNEWLAVKTVELYGELSTLYFIVEDFHGRISSAIGYQSISEEFKQYKSMFPYFTNGFPDGFKSMVHIVEQKEHMTGSDYAIEVMIWLEDQIDDPKIFPELAEEKFPKDFVEKHVRDLFRGMLIIIAVIYGVCWPAIVEAESEARVGKFFKRLYFFMKRFELLEEDNVKVFTMNPLIKSFVDFKQFDVDYKFCQRMLDTGIMA